MRIQIPIFFIIILSLACVSAYADDYYARQAKQYTTEAEYYQKKAYCYRREAQYYLKKAEGYQREVAYYTRKGDVDRATDYNRRSDRAMYDYKTQMRYAANADDTAADYLRKAANALRK